MLKNLKNQVFIVYTLVAIIGFTSIFISVYKLNNAIQSNNKNFSNQKNHDKSKKIKMYLTSINQSVKVISNLETMKIIKLTRGTKVYKIGKKITPKNSSSTDYYKIEYKNSKNKVRTAYVNPKILVSKKEEIIKEKALYVRTASHIYSNNKQEIKTLVKKGSKLDILGYSDLDASTGLVKWYKVKIPNTESNGYIRSKYLTDSLEKSKTMYNQNNIMEIHNKRDDKYGAGSAKDLDFYPRKKINFENNIMPKEVNALYINTGTIKNADDYIKLAKGTRINAFVVDIKDNGNPAFPAESMKKYSPANYNAAKKYFNTEKEYKDSIKKLKDSGFYVIGRITVFKDAYFVKDHPESAITDTRTGKPFLHNNTHWPSAYQRNVWQFNVELAKESVEKFGFNEIQFDYIRFPDRTSNSEKKGHIDYKNNYNETKSQAVQRFLMYATDELHDLNVYVAGDVFGESAHNYVTPYGQYWSAISNVLDVISPMAYPDHFWYGDYGFNHPWQHPFEVLSIWSKMAVARQSEISTPAIIRPWIQSHDATVSPSRKYNSEEVSAQISAYYKFGINGGFMTWWSSSSISGYKSEIEAYKKKY
ncbi:MAG: putative glycoside hydrolase [Clostridiales bacterium]